MELIMNFMNQIAYTFKQPWEPLQRDGNNKIQISLENFYTVMKRTAMVAGVIIGISAIGLGIATVLACPPVTAIIGSSCLVGALTASFVFKSIIGYGGLTVAICFISGSSVYIVDGILNS
jgi:hypothetical protein